MRLLEQNEPSQKSTSIKKNFARSGSEFLLFIVDVFFQNGGKAIKSGFTSSTQRLYNAVSTSMQRHEVAPTLMRQCLNVCMPAGLFRLYVSQLPLSEMEAAKDFDTIFKMNTKLLQIGIRSKFFPLRVGPCPETS